MPVLFCDVFARVLAYLPHKAAELCLISNHKLPSRNFLILSIASSIASRLLA